MNLKTTYPGSSDPFEGDIELLLQGLPEGALVTRATVMLAPAKPEGGKLFEEAMAVTSPDNPGDWGATKLSSQDSCEIDFHSRRTICEVKGSGGIATLQVDLGGVYVGVADDGTFKGPDNSACQVDLSNENTWQELPGLTVNKIKLYMKGASLNIMAVKVRSTPSNVSVRLTGMPPLWTIPGEMATTRTSLDFAPVLNAFLAEAKARNGIYRLPFIIHSDTIARMDITISIDYHIRLPALPPLIPEIKMHYGYSGLPDIDKGLMMVSLPRGAKPVDGTHAILNGTFDAGRVAFGDMGDAGETDWIGVSHDMSLAQPFVLESEARGTGIDLHLKAEDGPASLSLTVQEDADGKPSGKVLAEANIDLEGQPSEESAWLSAQLPAAFRFIKDKRYWLVLQSLAGLAGWQTKWAYSQDEALQSSVDGGFSWRSAQVRAGAKPLAALFRVRETPQRFRMPVELQIGEGLDPEKVKFDQFSPLGRVEFEANFAEGLRKYLDKRGYSLPFITRRLLVNGNFEGPACGEANRIVMAIDGTTEKGFLPAETASQKDPVLRAPGLLELSVEDVSPDKIISSINQALGEDILSRIGSRIKYQSRVGMTGYARLYNLCSQLPGGWQVSGHALRWNNDDGPVAVLIEPLSLLEGSDTASSEEGLSSLAGQEKATLFQSVKVTEGCTYCLSFLYWTAKIILDSIGSSHATDAVSSLMGMATIPRIPLYIDPISPSWEVLWLDSQRQTLGQVSEKICDPGLNSIATGDMQNFRRILIAPPGSTGAVIRFIQPEPGVLMLREVSFARETELLINGSFRIYSRDGGDPLGWKLEGGQAERRKNGLLLRGDENMGTTIFQSTGVIGKDSFVLRCSAQQLNANQGANLQKPEERARMELQWLDESGHVGEPESLTFGWRDFPDHIWILMAPEKATQVEVRLIQPKGLWHLVVQSISLKRLEQVSIPLTFLAEAPGELAVSDMRVVYDLEASI